MFTASNTEGSKLGLCVCVFTASNNTEDLKDTYMYMYTQATSRLL